MDFADSISFLVGLAAQEGVLLVIVIGGGSWGLWFLSTRLWPWYSGTHRPAMNILREREIMADAAMSSAFEAQAAATNALTAVMSSTLNSSAPPDPGGLERDPSSTSDLSVRMGTFEE
jgi:hypothetical protein